MRHGFLLDSGDHRMGQRGVEVDDSSRLDLPPPSETEGLDTRQPTGRGAEPPRPRDPDRSPKLEAEGDERLPDAEQYRTGSGIEPRSSQRELPASSAARAVEAPRRKNAGRRPPDTSP
jgi:hypothetical protein